MSVERLFLAIGVCAAIAFTFVTPPFQVPDEVGHFWRAESIAYGQSFPRMTPKGAVATLPDGYAWLVTVFWRDTAGHPDVKFTWPQFRSAAWVTLHAEKSVEVVLPAGYTPVPYAPQIVAALAGRLLHLIPPVTFYAGRLLNAVAYLAIVAAAIRVAPNCKWVFAAAGLLPMALYLAASWSPDAITIAAVFFFIAAILRAPRNLAIVAVSGAIAGLCKPAYFLVVLLVFAISRLRWTARVAILLATVAGVALAMWNAQRAFVPSRPDAHVDPAAQIACMRESPSRFPEALGSELRVRGGDYVEQAIGRLGLLDVHLPPPVIWAEALLVILCAFAATSAVSVRVRVIAAIATTGTICGIFLASYLGWTPPCARFVDGVQGRYFLPVVPLAMMIVSAPLVRERIVSYTVVAVAAIGNVVALGAVVSRYYL